MELEDKRLEREEKKKERIHYELEREKLESERELKLKKIKMGQDHEKRKFELEEKLEMERLQLEKMKLETEKDMKTSDSTTNNRGSSNDHHPVKLLKLEPMKFDGNFLHWKEFWDSFEATINSNSSLQDVDKLNYLRAQLCCEAKDIISGLEITGTNKVTVELLKERYGKKQLMINAHYSQVRDLPTISTYYKKLWSSYDQIESHLRSLQALGQDIKNNFMVSLIQSKLPRMILAKLEKYKSTDALWTVVSLRKELKKYISVQEVGDRLVNLYCKGNISAQDQNHDNRQDKSFNIKRAVNTIRLDHL